VYQQGLEPGQLGVRATLSDVGATVCEFFGAPPPQNGTSFLSALRLTGDVL
jgi:phosphopentomutase